MLHYLVLNGSRIATYGNQKKMARIYIIKKLAYIKNLKMSTGRRRNSKKLQKMVAGGSKFYLSEGIRKPDIILFLIKAKTEEGFDSHYDTSLIYYDTSLIYKL